jgi:hypothetical protein
MKDNAREVLRLNGFICRARAIQSGARTRHMRMRAARLKTAADRRLADIVLLEVTPYVSVGA